jgi:DNA polymerase-3 subunit alpha
MLEAFKGASLPKVKELFDKPDNSVVKFTGIITKFKTILTKKNSSKMAFVTIADETGSIENVIFPKVFIQFESLIVENQAVYIEGKISSRNDEKSILIDSISLTLPENTKRFDFVINIPQGTSQSQLMDLNRLLKNNQNGHRGVIIMPNGKEITLPYGVKYNLELQQKIDKILKI